MESNSESMKNLAVETFFIEEVAPLIYDDEKLEKWNEMIESLGIEGQKALQSKPEEHPIPFLHMKRQLVRTFDVLCPSKCKFREFSVTPIPVEILEAIAVATRGDYFTNIVIQWDDQSPDPVVIGELKMWGEWNDYSYKTKQEAEAVIGRGLSDWAYQTEKYLIGKWADVARPINELVEMAKTRWTRDERTRLEKEMKELERKQEDIINNCDEWFS